MRPDALTRRTRSFDASAMANEPSGSATTLCGSASLAAVAGPPSPEYPLTPVPATVVIVPHALVPDVVDQEPPVGCRRDAEGNRELRGCRRAAVAREALHSGSRHGRDNPVRGDQI